MHTPVRVQRVLSLRKGSFNKDKIDGKIDNCVTKKVGQNKSRLVRTGSSVNVKEAARKEIWGGTSEYLAEYPRKQQLQ